MYDNIDFTLYRDHASGVDFLNDIPQHLNKVSTVGRSEYGDYVTGYLDNLKVSISESRVKIYSGSLCKYYLGNNFKTMGKGDTRKAIQQISDCLHVDMSQARVTRIDVAQNIIMKNPVSAYLPYLGQAQYYNRLEQNNGLYYDNNKRNLLFYGKVHEQKIKHNDIPDLYKGRNVLRYELRFKQRLGNQFNLSELTAKTLYEEQFYIDLTKRWYSEYNRIQKINTKLASIKATGSKKDFANKLALMAILEIGQPAILNKLKEWQQRGEITKKQAYDLRSYVIQLSSKSSSEEGNELINELDRKVEQAARHL